MSVTIYDLAEYCGVSKGTIDRALHSRPGVSEKTKGKILLAAKELNYSPNYTARSLAKGCTMTIGIVCYDLHNNFFPELIDYVEQKAKEHGYFLQLILSHEDLKTEKEGLNYLFTRHVDGIILFPIETNKNLENYLKQIRIPLVTVSNRFSKDFSHVGIDDRKAMRDAVKFIHKKEYDKIVYLSPNDNKNASHKLDRYVFKQRKEGYFDGMKDISRLEESIVMEQCSTKEMIDIISRNFEKHSKIALLCDCDSHALSAMKYLEEKGISVPGDIGVMGIDNIEILRFIKPRLSTIKYSVHEMASVALDILFDLINDNTKVRDYTLKYEIIEGETI